MTIGGAIWTIEAATAEAVIAQAARAAAIDQTVEDTTSSGGGPWRPPEWQNAPLVVITVPGDATTNNASATAQSVGGINPTSAPIVPSDGTVFQVDAGTHPGTPDQFLVFDAIIRTEHQQRIEKTQHPIQTGANISDHAFIMPARVTLEIGMSDVMDSFYPGDWTSNPSKSVSAYQTIVDLAKSRQALILDTRLDSYQNMLITDVSSPDTAETRFGARITVVFEELLTGTITRQPVSARSDLTDSTNQGTKTGIPVPDDIPARFMRILPENGPSVQNSGPWSSNPVTGGS